MGSKVVVVKARWLSGRESGLKAGRFRVRNQVDPVVPFDKVLILITKSLEGN